MRRFNPHSSALATRAALLIVLGIALSLAATPARADDERSDAPPDVSALVDAGSIESTQSDGADEEADASPYYLVPELKGAGYRISDGRRPYRGRLAFSPAYGELGAQKLYTIRMAFNPNSWLGWEAAWAHNPASSVHAVFHSLSALLRAPLPWRLQPYGSLGYGMMTVFPGRSIKADPVTKNAVSFGGGLEFFIRDDVALRSEIRNTTVIGREEGVDGSVSYSYREYTVGFSFYRSLGR